MTIFHREYLEYVVRVYGPDQKIMSTNCDGNPSRLGDYAIVYGKAGEMLAKLDEEERQKIPLANVDANRLR